MIFVEVKKSRDFARAAESLSYRQMQRILGAAEEFVAGEPKGLLTEMRFDVALVDAVGRIEILENACLAALRPAIEPWRAMRHVSGNMTQEF